MSPPPPRSCDPRPPRRTTASGTGCANCDPDTGLRSSVAPEDNRQLRQQQSLDDAEYELRSSV
ncbi:hypothetical protein, partial [Streptomyces viridosporus]|uniref:hypothetical protein n=1 Tax=Streptomyces viridosporus TaxID=67581 RepID=UPI003325B183